MTCLHTATFDCHGDRRCSTCLVDALTLTDDSLLWPSQDDPSTYDAERIAKWFDENRIFALHQGADGFEFCRNQKDGVSTYGYLWVEVVLDLDFQMAYMLDIRKDEDDETRQFLFLAFGPFGVIEALEWHPTIVKWRDENLGRLTEALHWFADRTAAWLAQPRPERTP